MIKAAKPSFGTGSGLQAMRPVIGSSQIHVPAAVHSLNVGVMVLCAP